MAGSSVELWQYTDEGGSIVVVDSVDKIPPAQRDKATKIVLAPRASTTQLRAPEPPDVHWPSFGAGVAVALGLALGLRVMWSGAKMVLKVAAVVVIVGALAGGYFGVIRQKAGLGSGMASPQELVDDAKRAADQAKKMIDKQERELRKIEGK